MHQFATLADAERSALQGQYPTLRRALMEEGTTETAEARKNNRATRATTTEIRALRRASSPASPLSSPNRCYTSQQPTPNPCLSRMDLEIALRQVTQVPATMMSTTNPTSSFNLRSQVPFSKRNSSQFRPFKRGFRGQQGSYRGNNGFKSNRGGFRAWGRFGGDVRSRIDGQSNENGSW